LASLSTSSWCPLLLHSSSFFFYSYGAPRALHSFPTRRSSDLPQAPDRRHGVPGEAAQALGEGLELASDRPGRVDQGLHVVERDRSEEHTSELQSLTNLVCRLLLEKKKHILHHLHPSRVLTAAT